MVHLELVEGEAKVRDAKEEKRRLEMPEGLQGEARSRNFTTVERDGNS